MTDSRKPEFNFAEHERPFFDAWKQAGCFKRSKGFGKYSNQSYTVVIPPPNVTGMLHMGHALNDTLQDTCVRHARMQGYKTRWILGTDHAGIATQTKVDKYLQEQGINRREIGREKFIDACQDWRRKYGTTIVNQISMMGCSCDYDDEQFTMSDEFSEAVRKLFVDWYHDGLIYRGKRIVNWCPHCTTAIADDEAEYEDEHGHLWYLRYPLKEPVDGLDYLIVATTRPETMLGDTGVAVSPQDERYKNLVGKTVLLPIVNREIPIFSDFYVDKEFGTGCVKTTPAHDPNDFAMGERHDLEKINIFDETAHVVEGYGKFSGMSRDEAREAIVAEFDNLGLLDHIEDHEHNVMHCYRCHNTLEPWLSEQWFVAVEELKHAAAEVVKNGSITFYPARWAQVYLDWLENLKDWCISRQLWWGHRIPMFYCDECGFEDASVEVIHTCPKCGSELRQDEDVLDTWFSSQLWPFATQGWGQDGLDASELVEHYPTQVLTTARDILGLWVARMIMSSLYCTKQIPFEDVFINPTVMGADGKPMSKSRGNGVDPVELMQKFGADGMRFGLLMQVTGAQSLNFNEAKIETSRNFANKIRNAARFVNMHLDGYEPGEPVADTAADKWIFSRLAKLVQSIDSAYEEYEFSEMAKELYGFFWNEFCDWYIEFSKARLTDSADCQDKLTCQRNLVFVLDVALRLLHPIMPFVTEEIYQDLPFEKDTEFLMNAPWPDAESLKGYISEDAERRIQVVCDTVSAIRSVRSRYGISPKQGLEVVVKANESDSALLNEQNALLAQLANVSKFDASPQAIKPSMSGVMIAPGLEIYVVLAGFVDFEAEKNRLIKEQEKVQKEAEKLSKKLSNEGFLAKAAQEIIDKDKTHLAECKDTLVKIENQLRDLL